jgi:hypothetical protein
MVQTGGKHVDVRRPWSERFGLGFGARERMMNRDDNGRRSTAQAGGGIIANR